MARPRATARRSPDGGRRRFGIVFLRQTVDRLRHRLSFVPGLYVLGSIVAVAISLWIDRSLAGESLPKVLTTTVASARSVFTVIAGGLITAITLLLSLMLVTVQLASSQYSPRTLRDWLGNRTVQHTIGLTLGTTVFCLLGLRSTRAIDDGLEVTPHITVIVALVLGVASLFAVVGSVDHLTNSLRIGAVANRLADETIKVVRANEDVRAGEAPTVVPARFSRFRSEDQPDIPDDAWPVETPLAGWIQQVDVPILLEGLPDGATGYVVVPLGGFAVADSPLMWVSPAPAADDEEEIHGAMLAGFALGDSRTMQQDIGYGLIQLTDIAVRALSPGVNDPSTAADVVVHIGSVLTALWERQPAQYAQSDGDRTIVSPHVDHRDHLRRAFDPIRRYGSEDPVVLGTMLRTLRLLRSETLRRALPGPIEPIDEMIDDIVATAQREGWSAQERTTVEA